MESWVMETTYAVEDAFMSVTLQIPVLDGGVNS